MTFVFRLDAAVSLLVLRLVGSVGVVAPMLVEEDTTVAASVEVLSLVEGGGQKAGLVREDYGVVDPVVVLGKNLLEEIGEPCCGAAGFR